MNGKTEEEMARLVAWFRKEHGIEEGTIYDPYLHDNVPALAFGPKVPYSDLQGPAHELDPERDLFEALWAQSGESAQ